MSSARPTSTPPIQKESFPARRSSADCGRRARSQERSVDGVDREDVGEREEEEDLREKRKL